MCNNDEVVNNLSDFFFFFAEDFWDKTLLLEMNFTESMNVVHNRIQQLEPENASKIIGYLLLMQEHGDRDMIRLAFCPDSVMRSMINFVKCELAKDPRYYSPPSDHLPIRSSFGSFTGSSIQPPSASVSPPLRIGSWENSTEVDSLQFLNFDESMTSPEFSSGFFSRDHQCLPLRTSRRSPSLPEFPVKICHYFSKGHCKHGNNCRYFHGQIIPERESFSQMFNPNNVSDEEHVVSPGSLEKLEGEIIELLKSRRGAPISIASLPMMYFEKYGRTLQAEGYLTESQRHGKAGYSLTKLLARLKNTIRLIDRLVCYMASCQAKTNLILQNNIFFKKNLRDIFFFSKYSCVFKIKL